MAENSTAGTGVDDVLDDQSPDENKSAAIKMKPTVVHIARRGGVVVQNCDVYIGRACNIGGWNLPRSKCANPFSIKDTGSVSLAVERFHEYILNKPDLLAQLHELEGKTLGCWCKPGPCHGDILVTLFAERCM